MAKHALVICAGSLIGAAAISAAIAPSAKAAFLTYDFTVNVTSGGAIGRYDGNFRFDASKPLILCDAVRGFYCANPVDNNLTVQFDFLGKTYTEKDDSGFNLFPNVVFNSPVINAQSSQDVALSFLVSPPQADGFFIFGGDFRMGRGTDLFSEATSVGNVVIRTLQLPGPQPGPQPGPHPEPVPEPCAGDSCTAVPEPSEIAGSVVALGLLGLVWRSRRKRSTLKVK
jgi:hypothetical protein